MPPLVKVVLVVLGIVAVAVGIIYLVEPIHSLPSRSSLATPPTGRSTITTADTSQSP